MKKNIVIVGTPLHFLNAIEACYSFNISLDSCFFIFYYPDQCTKKQLQTMSLSLLKDSKKSFVKHFNHHYWTRKFNLLPYFLIRFKIFSFGKVENLILGDFLSNHSQSFLCVSDAKRVIFVDDGAMSLRLASPNNHYIDFSFYKKMGILRKYLFNLKLKEKTEKILFSMFNLPSSDSIQSCKNEFSYFKKYLINEDIQVDDSLFYFIGQPLSESEVVTEKDEIEFVKKICANYTDIKIHYIPHRRESKLKIDKLKKDILNIQILNIPSCIEIYLAKNSKFPGTIGTYYSSAFITMPVLFPDKKNNFISFLIPEDKVKIKSEDFQLANVYKTISQYCKIVSIDDFNEVKL